MESETLLTFSGDMMGLATSGMGVETEVELHGETTETCRPEKLTSLSADKEL